MFSQLIRALQSILEKRIYSETYIVLVFTFISLFVGQNKVYLFLLIVLLSSLFLINKNIIEVVWIGFISTILFSKGRMLFLTILNSFDWVGEVDFQLPIIILFSDLLFVVLVYLLITRRNHFVGFNQKLRPNLSIIGWLLIFLLSLVLSVVNSRFMTVSMYYFIQISKNIIIFFVSIFIFTNSLLTKKTMQIIAMQVAIISLFVFAQYFHQSPIGLPIEDLSRVYGTYADENPGLYRPGGIYSDPNIMGTLIVCLLPMIVASIILEKKKNSKYFLIILGVIYCGALLLTGSRASILLSFATLIIFSIKFGLYKSLRELIGERFQYFIWFLVFIMIVLSLPRLVTIVTAFDPATGGATFRFNHIKMGILYLKSNPLGIGIGSFMYQLAIDPSAQTQGLMPKLPHNQLSGLGAEAGVMGLTSFMIFLITVINKKWINLGSEGSVINYAMLISFLWIILLSQIYPWFINYRTTSWLWILAAYGITPAKVLTNTIIRKSD